MRSVARRIITLFAGLLYASSALAAAPLAPHTGNAAETQSPTPQAVQRAVKQLLSWYDPRTGLWETTGWWNSANALTALIDYARATHTSRYDRVIAQTYAANIHMGFINQYYDDEGWWALAWIDAYDLTGQQRYLRTAQQIFSNMTTGWDDTCGGGLWWSKKRTYKNAIPNELFLSVAARLSNRVRSSKDRFAYAAWATREWRWFRHSGMIEHDHLISDGLTSTCQDNHKTKWSYNQGVILGGLAALARHDHSRRPLRIANKIASSAIQHLSGPNGILREPCEPSCDGDSSQFKGIFVRNLAVLYQNSPRTIYRQFILRNASSILRSDQTPDHTLGLVWSGQPGKPNASTQSSALDALVAALQITSQKAQP